MAKLKRAHKKYLSEKFRNRINFNKTERKLYSHDIAAMPSLIKPLVGRCIPHAVIQPETEQELVELVQWAVHHKMPLTPRGKASSGYEGVLPVKKGIVVDFYRMSRMLRVDPEAQTATVQAGMIWEKVDRELDKHGMTLRLYPTSYPSSTVGGWLAQGGAGIGSYESGYFRDNVISARVVLPDGNVREIRGDELDLVADVEGITGFISEVTFHCMPKESLDVVAVGCVDVHELEKLVQNMIDEELPIWSLVFINPRMAELKNKAPLMQHMGHPIEERVLLPASYIVVLAFRSKDNQIFHERLPEIVKAHNADILSDRIAHHEWEHRFKLMVVKRLGPSLVPAEVIIPLSSLGQVMTEIENRVD